MHLFASLRMNARLRPRTLS